MLVGRIGFVAEVDNLGAFEPAFLREFCQSPTAESASGDRLK